MFPLVLVAEAFALTYIGVAATFPLPLGAIVRELAKPDPDANEIWKPVGAVMVMFPFKLDAEASND